MDTRVLENGTMIGSLNEASKTLAIPEIVISSSYSNSSLHQSRCCGEATNNTSSSSGGTATSFETAVESTALLEGSHQEDQHQERRHQHHDMETSMHHDEFDQFIMNRTISESNMLESSIYSELQFPPSIGGASLHGGAGSGSNYYGTTGRPNTSPQTPSSRSRPSSASPAVDGLNSSTCSRPESRNTPNGKRNVRRKHKSKAKCQTTPRVVANQHTTTMPIAGPFPPQYTTIYMDGGGAANAMGQLANAAATSPFLQTSTEAQYMQQQYQYYQQRPMMTTMPHHLGHHHRTLLNTSYGQPDALGSPAAGGPAAISPGLGAVMSTVGQTPSALLTPPPVVPSTRISFRKWFSRPSLPFVIGILALGGVACTLGGIVLGSTGLIEHSTQYLSAALLMIGIGVSLLVISGAIWRLSLPDETDECPCFRHMETCRNCNSPYCSNRLMPGGYMYPEFQHRPPPPSYLTSLNECGSMGLLFHPATSQPAYSAVRVNTPPPLYRSTNSLSVYPPVMNSSPSPLATNGLSMAGAAPLAVLPEQNAILESNPLTKEINYLELD